MRSLAAPVLLAVALAACRVPGGSAPSRSPVSPPAPTPDPHSRAQPARVLVRHVSLDLTLDFAARKVRGQATLSFDRLDPAAPLVLDTNGLVIQAVTGSDGAPRPHTVAATDPVLPILGGPLTVTLAPGDQRVAIRYETSERSGALQWLDPAQTHDRKQPFLFTQGQFIYTRSWIPIQDSPGVRVTYDATVRAPAELTVLMSAERQGRGADGAWRFRMRQPIPPYLIALAAGALAFEPISARAGVFAEPSRVKGARSELSDTEAMIAAAEALFGPYRWERYDILILPPAFPFGGMENPRLTFATPTILAGDRSLVSLVAHELAHSWSGNLVTNATWNDFWLNEGFTSYFEQRIMERVFGSERADIERSIERARLEKELTELEPWQEVLHMDLAGKDPDDGFSSVPYEKGALFLRRLEELYGRPRFDAFLRRHFDANAFRSVSTEAFVATLRRELLATDPEKAAELDLDLWIEKPGLPSDAPRVESRALTAVDAERARFLAGTAPASLDRARWSTQEWQHFLRGLPRALTLAQMRALDGAFAFTMTGNSEILFDWLLHVVEHDYAPAYGRLADFLMNTGRRKFVKPLYAALAKTPAGLARARAIYAAARPRYHASVQAAVDKLLEKGG